MAWKVGGIHPGNPADGFGERMADPIEQYPDFTFCSDTVEELAEKIGIDPTALSNTPPVTTLICFLLPGNTMGSAARSASILPLSGRRTTLGHFSRELPPRLRSSELYTKKGKHHKALSHSLISLFRFLKLLSRRNGFFLSHISCKGYNLVSVYHEYTISTALWIIHAVDSPTNVGKNREM